MISNEVRDYPRHSLVHCITAGSINESCFTNKHQVKHALPVLKGTSISLITHLNGQSNQDREHVVKKWTGKSPFPRHPRHSITYIQNTFTRMQLFTTISSLN
jgi:hypothetical protein